MILGKEKNKNFSSIKKNSIVFIEVKHQENG